MKTRSLNILAYLLLALILVSAGLFAIYKIRLNNHVAKPAPAQEKDKYLAFTEEIYDTIQQNYWEKISDEQLTELFRLAAEKVNSSTPATLATKDKAGLDTLVAGEIKNMSEGGKVTFVSSVADVVLANLQPFGRSRLYTQRLTQDLSNAVHNVDPSTNLYNSLGVDKNASQEQIEKQYQEKSSELSKQNTPEAKQQLALVNRAHEALQAPDRRQQYDQTGAEPTVTYRLMNPSVFYVKIGRFSPVTMDEFTKAAKTQDSAGPELNTLILDLRGNIGGDIDLLPYMLGPFVGPNNYAYDFYRQGAPVPNKTITGWLPSLVRYKKVIILVDSQTQSSAEVMAAALKKYNVGVVLGTPTKGWGTIERIFNIKNQISNKELYAVFLVHTITLRDDGQPIEGRGVDPTISTGSKDWGRQLDAYYNFPPLKQALTELEK